MAKKVTLSEEQLTRVIKNILEQELGDDETLAMIDDIELDQDVEDEEGLDALEEILGLQEDQIVQLQDRVQYVEELNADVLEFVSYLMSDLEKAEGLELKKSKQKLRALETRAGREIFWLKSRRL